MEYRLIIYKNFRNFSSKLPGQLLLEQIFDEENIYDTWRNSCCEGCLEHFDAEKVKCELEKRTVIAGNEKLCYIKTDYTSNDRKPLLILTSSYEKIEAVKAAIIGVLAENRLSFYDVERKQCFLYSDFMRESFLSVKQRSELINAKILNEISKNFRIKQIGFLDDGTSCSCDFVITLCEREGVSFEACVWEFYSLLKTLTVDDEELLTDNKCFTISGAYYTISYTLEAYGGNADKIGFVEDSKIVVEEIQRMSCEKAISWADENMMNKGADYGYCMYKTEMRDAYPNPAERFVKGINIKQQMFEDTISYSYADSFGGAVTIEPFGENLTESEQEVSCLAIDELDIIPLYDVILEFSPRIYEDFYDETYITKDNMFKIIDKMQDVRSLILNDTFSDELKPYIREKDSFSFLIFKEACSQEDKDLFYSDYYTFLYNNRYEAVRIYDIFIAWVKSQIESYDKVVFVFSGP